MREDGEEEGGADGVHGEAEAEAEWHGEVRVGVDEGGQLDVSAQGAEERGEGVAHPWLGLGLGLGLGLKPKPEPKPKPKPNLSLT